MTALSTEAIRSRLAENELERKIIVSPLLDDVDQIKDGQASIDLRLGFEFRLVSPSSFGSIGEFGDLSPHSILNLYRREYIPIGSSLVIHPHQFMLAQTLEFIRLPTDLMAYVIGRSTWGRFGLIVATAIGVHPNFAGNLTLELRNLGETPLELFPGQTIAQLFFHSVVDKFGQPALVKATQAQYTGSIDMVPGKISSEPTHNTLKKLVERSNSRSQL